MHTNHLIGRRRHKGSTCFALCSRRLACTSLVAAIILIGHTDSAITAPAVNITYVGQAALANYRTTTSLKPLDLDGDNVFGTAGYVFYGTDVLNNSNGGSVSTTDPLAYSSGTRRTKLSLPAWLTLFNNGQNRIATSYPSYPVIDDPALVPSPSVTDLQLGVAVRDPVLHGTEASFVNIRLNTGMPAGGVRVGVACFAGTGDAIDLIRLTNNFNAGAVVTRTATGAPVLYFFDVTGAQPGDIVTLRLSKNPTVAGWPRSRFCLASWPTAPRRPMPSPRCKP